MQGPELMVFFRCQSNNEGAVRGTDGFQTHRPHGRLPRSLQSALTQAPDLPAPPSAAAGACPALNLPRTRNDAANSSGGGGSRAGCGDGSYCMPSPGSPTSEMDARSCRIRTSSACSTQERRLTGSITCPRLPALRPRIWTATCWWMETSAPGMSADGRTATARATAWCTRGRRPGAMRRLFSA